uniref:ribonuclease H n=1 Tax=Laticauda laticaudata TaxID=8630 RepID=A0A8C5S998_LATLA
IKVGGKDTSFLLETGASQSVITRPIAPPSEQQIQVQGWTMLQSALCQLGETTLQHQFLYMLECSIPLLGRDLLTKLQVTVIFSEEGHDLQIHHPPKNTCISKYLKVGILRTAQSPWNTPILPVKKPDGTYRPVQDLRPMNSVTIIIHPVVAHPYTLLSTIPRTAQWFSVLDLKDTFFTIPIHLRSQPLFTCTRPVGFKNSPTLFGAALSRDLEHFLPCHPQDVLLQYVDDLLVSATTEKNCLKNTHFVLKLLQDAGYRVSKSKAQLVRKEVKYLGCHLSKGLRALRES